MKLMMESVQELYIQGKLYEADYNRKAIFEFTYDMKNNILHLLDRDDHNGSSLINSIHSHVRDWFISKLAKQGIYVERETVRCFLYQDDEITEYVFEYEKNKKHPFEHLSEMKDKALLYPAYVEYVKNWKGMIS